ncbi:thymidine kinase [Arthrobacter sp. PAMC 25486]|nr:thymidine kinase [Arthrobacter sp. PAMC 25486]
MVGSDNHQGVSVCLGKIQVRGDGLVQVDCLGNLATGVGGMVLLVDAGALNLQEEALLAVLEQVNRLGCHGGQRRCGDDPDALLKHVDLAPVACLLVDEAQFLDPAQVDDLFRIAGLDGVPVLAYGLRTDFRTRAFPGAARLMEIAHSLEELKTICRCGRKAMFNTRRVGDQIVFDGEQVAIDGADVWYESLCGNCYLEASGGQLGA